LLSVSESVLSAPDDIVRHDCSRLQVERSGVGTWDLDFSNYDLQWSDTTRAIFGIHSETPVSYDLFLSLLEPHDREHVQGTIQALFESGGNLDASFKLLGTPGLRGGLIREEAGVPRHLRNALDAMAESPQRELIATSTKLADHMVEVTISETGPVVPDDVLGNLFRAFFTNRQTGMGIGLSIRPSIVEVHDGRMWAENNPLGTATFRFTLPAVPNES
jgi:hypothetical protein